MRRISPLSTRVPVRVALPVARVAVRRVQGRYTVRKVPPRPRPSRASPSRCGSDPLKATRHIQASAQAVGRAGCPRHPYSHSGPRVTVALLRLPTRGLGGGGGGLEGISRLPPPGPEVQSTSRLRADYAGPVTRAAPRARGPAGALARGIAPTPPEVGCRAARRYAGVGLRLVGVHALVVHEQLAQPRPSRRSRRGRAV